MNDFPDAQLIKTSETTLAIYEAGNKNDARPPIILVHGWPEIAYSWKHQLKALCDAGYRAIAVDLKGFGRSDAPKDPALYDINHMTADFCALLDALNIERAIFCGHDWGGALVWSMAQMHPERVAGAISLCTPLHPRPPVEPLKIIKKRFGPEHYFIQFQEPDVPEQLFATDPHRFFQLMFRRPPKRKRWPLLVPMIYDVPGRFKTAPTPTESGMILSPDDVEVYVDAYTRSGFHGGVNLYRNIDRNWALMEGRNEIVRAPSLWIGADLDLFLPPETADGMEALVPNLEKHIVPECGHWMMWEKPAEASALIIDWLNRRFSA